jgi:hypothetical protein
MSLSRRTPKPAARYLGDIAQKAAFNQIGEVLSTIVLDGRVVGSWAWNPTAKRARHQLVPGRCPPNRANSSHTPRRRSTAVISQSVK